MFCCLCDMYHYYSLYMLTTFVEKYDSNELLSLKWKLHVLHAWLSKSKHSYSSGNAADVADSLTTTIYTLQCIFYLMFPLQSHFDKSTIYITIISKIKIAVFHTLILDFMIFQRRVKMSKTKLLRISTFALICILCDGCNVTMHMQNMLICKQDLTSRFRHNCCCW